MMHGVDRCDPLLCISMSTSLERTMSKDWVADGQPDRRASETVGTRHCPELRGPPRYSCERRSSQGVTWRQRIGDAL